jgi:adenylylsulfate kinase-like enzyme
MRMILISGIPGAGKTTVARMLAARLRPRSVHIEGDLIGHHFIVNGLVPPQGPPADEAEAQIALRRRNICLLADSFAGAGFVPVIDDVVVSASVLDLYRRLLKPWPLALVQLVPDIEVVRRRDADRDKHVFEIWGHLDTQLRTSMPRVGLWLDTSALTAAETVDRIAESLDQATIEG